ncbi:uncharacterized protein LOC111251450 isoform X2 [Varroa destructor]|uniref:Uncharacterized protein n=1 Tax=Varroa destructor TaxID=109461 RepID=A0A7M7KA39_VARDE|nr:uncharacterized protein LOC111251450 isoform X2 [Varroa destructor]
MPDQQLFPFAVINPIARREALAVPRPSRTPTASTGSLGNLQGTSGPQGFFDPIIPLRPQNTPSQLQLAAQTRHEADEWVAAIQSRISASSLDIEGLNLEGCSSYVPIESASDHHGAISQTLQLLDELLRETPVVMETNANTGNGGNAKEPVANATMCAGVVGGQGAAASAVGADVAPQLQAKAQLQSTVSTPAGDDIAAGAKPKLHTSWSEEEREQHASIMAHQQALRRATHLRQRKISTELKLETIQKQLRRTKKAQPKAIPEEGNDRSAFEEQLQELTETLKTLEGNLGQTELEAQKTKRNWDSKMEEVYKHIYDPATILNIDQWAERKNTSGRASTRRIGGGSLRVRAAKFIQSPRPRKKPHDTNTNGGSKDGSDKHGGGGGSNVEDSDTDEKSSGARTLGAKQGRRGTFRVFGSLLDSKRGRFGGSGKQQQPYGSGQGQQQQGKDGHVTNNFSIPSDGWLPVRNEPYVCLYPGLSLDHTMCL